MILEHATGGSGWEVCRSGRGTQNFVSTSHWCTFGPQVLESVLNPGPEALGEDNLRLTHARLVFDEKRSLVAYASFGEFVWGDARHMFHSYVDGTREGIECIFELLLYDCARLGLKDMYGYVPKLDWLAECFRRNPAFVRPTQTEQFEFHWRNIDYIGRS